MSLEQAIAWIDGQQDEMVSLQEGLTARPAMDPRSGGTGEWGKARFLEAYLRRHGLDDIAHYDCPDDQAPEGSRPNFAVSARGAADVPRIWVMSHLDVVPPGEQLPDGSWKGWKSDPFRVRRAGDMLVGRGVADNHQAVVSSIFALRALLEHGLEPANAVRLLFVSDEETGSSHGLVHLLQEHADLFAREDGIIVPDWGQEDGAAIEVAEKGVLWLEFCVKGRQSHGSRPDLGVNAFRAATWLVRALDEGLARTFDKPDHLYDVPRSTFEPTLHRANVPNVNTIPGEDVFCFDCRVLPCYGLDSVLAFVDAQCRSADGVFGTTTEMTVRNRQDAPPPTPSDAPVVKLLSEAIR